MLLEIALNTGSVVLEGAGGLPRCAFGLDTRRVSTRVRSSAASDVYKRQIRDTYTGQMHGMLAHFMVRLYIAVVCK